MNKHHAKEIANEKASNKEHKKVTQAVNYARVLDHEAGQKLAAIKFPKKPVAKIAPKAAKPAARVAVKPVPAAAKPASKAAPKK